MSTEETSISPGAASVAVGVVVIGRNEGARLVRCLQSIVGSVSDVVYVDSGSTDGSVERIREMDVRVVELNPALPFTAARARNSGFEALMDLAPGSDFVQFVDGDTELLPGWLETAATYLQRKPDVAVACGALRERTPEANSYSRLAQIEWEGEPGEVRAAGGNAMIRAGVFQRVGGFNVQMIAGEDPELCVRIRRAGYRIVRLSQEMGVHDSGMIRFRQWLRRSIRDGHAYSEILYLQGLEAEPYWKRRLASIVLWGGIIPLAAVIAAWPTAGGSLLLMAAIGALWIRIYRRRRGHKATRGGSALYASHCVLRKSAECLGVALFVWNCFGRRRATRLIEHKG